IRNRTLNMPTVYEGSLSTPPGRFAIVAAKFNQEVVQKLVDGSLQGLHERGVRDETIDLMWVPGSFEIPLVATRLAPTPKYAPLVAARLAASAKYAAVICLGAVIRGETDHYDHICNQAAAGVAQAALATGVPVIFGILTCETEEQALERAGGKEGNKGFDAALAAIEMANLLKQLPGA